MESDSRGILARQRLTQKTLHQDNHITLSYNTALLSDDSFQLYQKSDDRWKIFAVIRAKQCESFHGLGIL